MRVATETSTRDFGTGKLELSLVVFDYTEAERQAIFAMCSSEPVDDHAEEHLVGYKGDAVVEGLAGNGHPCWVNRYGMMGPDICGVFDYYTAEEFNESCDAGPQSPQLVWDERAPIEG